MIAEPIVHDHEPDGPIDERHVLMLLTEVRPDTSLPDFKDYANLPEEQIAPLLARVIEAGMASIYDDEVNPPIVCLTPLGAKHMGVVLSDDHPPIWTYADGRPAPIFAVAEEGVVFFTDMDARYGEPGDDEFAFEYVDTRQKQPVEVLVDVERHAGTLLRERMADGRLTPRNSEFSMIDLGVPWPREVPFRASPTTPSATVWLEQHTVCPFCRTLPRGQICHACGGHAPGRVCPACHGRSLSFYELCVLCNRSGIDFLLEKAEPPIVRRAEPARNGRLKGGR